MSKIEFCQKDIRISFVGDIMCERPLLKNSYINGQYDFRSVFENTKSLLKKSDYVVGNLETVFAGKEAGYTKSLYSFNTPDEFLDALQSSEIDLVLTANNHCMDRGIQGLRRTLQELDKRGVEHIGTYLSKEERNKIFIKVLGNIRFAFLNYTYGTGIKDNHIVLEGDELDMVNLLIPQKIGSPIKYNPDRRKMNIIKKILGHFISESNKLRIKKSLGWPVGAVKIDEIWDDIIDQNVLDRLKKDIRLAKNSADYVILNVHNGGQFNPVPGKFSEFIMEFCVDAGADLIVGHHPHVVQRAEIIQDVPCVYSLGNYSISPSTPYMLFEDLPQYSIALHMHFDTDHLKINESSFSILKILENSCHRLTVMDTYDLYKNISDFNRQELMKDVKIIFEKVTMRQIDNFKIEKEYQLFAE